MGSTGTGAFTTGTGSVTLNGATQVERPQGESAKKTEVFWMVFSVVSLCSAKGRQQTEGFLGLVSETLSHGPLEAFKLFYLFSVPRGHLQSIQAIWVGFRCFDSGMGGFASKNT